MKTLFKKLLSSKTQSKHFSETVQRIGKNNAGFSLVELIVVIAIMAILATVAVIGVSVYIPKAQEAADNELLNVLTDALVAACLSEGVDQRDVRATIDVDSNGELAKSGSKIAINITGTDKKDAIADLFNQIYTDNAKLNLISDKTLMFDGSKFVVTTSNTVTEDYRGNSITISKDKLNSLVNSNLGGLGAGTLLGETSGAASWAGSNLEGGAEFQKAFRRYLGLPENASEDELDEAIFALADENGQDPSVAGPTIYSNALALYAAECSEGVTKDAVLGWLNGGTTDDIQSKGDGQTLGEASAIYALYLSYQGNEFDKDGDKVFEGADEGDNDVLKVMGNALGDPDFKEWVDTDEADIELEAYLSAMSIVSEATKDPSAASAVLINGFADPELVELMEKLMS